MQASLGLYTLLSDMQRSWLEAVTESVQGCQDRCVYCPLCCHDADSNFML